MIKDTDGIDKSIHKGVVSRNMSVDHKIYDNSVVHFGHDYW